MPHTRFSVFKWRSAYTSGHARATDNHSSIGTSRALVYRTASSTIAAYATGTFSFTATAESWHVYGVVFGTGHRPWRRLDGAGTRPRVLLARPVPRPTPAELGSGRGRSAGWADVDVAEVIVYDTRSLGTTNARVGRGLPESEIRPLMWCCLRSPTRCWGRSARSSPAAAASCWAGRRSARRSRSALARRGPARAARARAGGMNIPSSVLGTASGVMLTVSGVLTALHDQRPDRLGDRQRDRDPDDDPDRDRRRRWCPMEIRPPAEAYPAGTRPAD